MRHIPRSSALALLAGGAVALAAPVAAQTATRLRIGAMAIDPFGEAYYGAEVGIFRRHGIDAEVTTLPNGSTILQSVIAGDLDVGIANIVQVAAAVARGIPVQVIAPAALFSSKHAYSKLCVAKDSPFKGAADLAHATIAVSTLNDFNQLGVEAWLEKNGVSTANVHFVELPFSEMGAALRRGTIGAATIAEPAMSAAIRRGDIRPFANVYSAIAPEFANIVWFAPKKLAAEKPALLKNLVAAIYDSGRWANAHPADSARILAKVAKMKPDVVAGMTRAYYATSSDPTYLAAPLAFAARYHMLKQPVTVAQLLGTAS